MTIFDLLFLAAFLVSVIALIAAAYAAIRGNVPRAFSILGVWLVCAAAYLGASVAVAYAAPQRVIAAGEPWCFDDWCLTVENVKRTDSLYNVNLRISSEAKRVTQRANGAWIYLRDENDRHYEPLPDPAAVPLDVLLQPGESVAAKRTFPGARERPRAGPGHRARWPALRRDEPGRLSAEAAACFTSRP